MTLPAIKNKKTSIILASVLVAAFFFSMIFFLVNRGGKRRVFVFPSVETGSSVVEIRRLPETHMSEVEYYISEMMLGPQTERCRRIFPAGTKVLSCMLKNKVLYVNLSKEIVNPETENKMLPVKDSIELFKSNILRNFSSISSVEVFVEGNPAYEGFQAI